MFRFSGGQVFSNGQSHPSTFTAPIRLFQHASSLQNDTQKLRHFLAVGTQQSEPADPRRFKRVADIAKVMLQAENLLELGGRESLENVGILSTLARKSLPSQALAALRWATL